MRFFEVQRGLHSVESSSSSRVTFEPGPGMPVFATLVGRHTIYFPCSRKGETDAVIIPTDVSETFGSIVLFNSFSPDGSSSQDAHIVTGLTALATPEDPLIEVTPINDPSKARDYSVDWFKILQRVNTRGESLKMFGRNPDNRAYHILAESFPIDSLHTLTPFGRLTELMHPMTHAASGHDVSAPGSSTRVQKNLFGGSNPEYGAEYLASLEKF